VEESTSAKTYKWMRARAEPLRYLAKCHYVVTPASEKIAVGIVICLVISLPDAADV